MSDEAVSFEEFLRKMKKYQPKFTIDLKRIVDLEDLEVKDDSWKKGAIK